VSPDHAALTIGTDGAALLDRLHATTTFHLPEAVPEAALVHPHLGFTGAVAARWRGGLTFHAAGVLLGGGILGLLGDREAGKSTTVARLHARGAPVATDDVLVVEPTGEVSPGPRCLDLRPDAARRLALGEPAGVLGARERFRAALPPCPPAPLRGWVELAWSREWGVERVPAAERLGVLARQLTLRIPPAAPGLLLDLAVLPMWRLSRPRSPAALEPAVAWLEQH
jgi:hypothetical protein